MKMKMALLKHIMVLECAKVFNALPLSIVIDACSPSICRQRAVFIHVSHFILTFKA